MNVNPKIKNIIVNISDFLVEPDIKSGTLHLSTNGGLNLILTASFKPKNYLVKSFFKMLEDIPGTQEVGHSYYFADLPFPPIIIDHLMNTESDEILLKKAIDHIKDKVSWRKRDGYIAMAEMTFNQTKFHKEVPENLELINKLSQHFTIHILANWSRTMLDKMEEESPDIFKDIQGLKITSSDIKALKCSQAKSYDIYKRFFETHDIDPETCCFLETDTGYIESLDKYASDHQVNISRLLYVKDKRDDFLKSLSIELGLSV